MIALSKISQITQIMAVRFNLIREVILFALVASVTSCLPVSDSMPETGTAVAATYTKGPALRAVEQVASGTAIAATVTNGGQNSVVTASAVGTQVTASSDGQSFAAATRTPYVALPTSTGSITAEPGTLTATMTPAATAVAGETNVIMEVWSSVSPDGGWVSEGQLLGVQQGNMLMGYRTVLTLINKSAGVLWRVADGFQEVGLGATVPKVVHWGMDGRTAYITEQGFPEGGCWPDLVDGSGLQRVNLETGQVESLLPATTFAFSFAGDDTAVASIARLPEEPGIYLHDLINGSSEHIPLEVGYGDAGNIVWSPDGQQMVMTQILPPGYCQSENHNILLVDRNTLAMRILVEDVKNLITVDWPTDDKILLKDGGGDLWELDVFGGELTRTSHSG